MTFSISAEVLASHVRTWNIPMVRDTYVVALTHTRDAIASHEVPVTDVQCSPISSVHHIALLVTDLSRAEAFYGGVLGLVVNRRWFMPDGVTPRSIWFALGSDSFLAVELARVPVAAAETERALGWTLVALSIGIGDRERWRERLAAAGFPVINESTYTLYFCDPEGHRVGLSHWPHPAKPSTVQT